MKNRRAAIFRNARYLLVCACGLFCLSAALSQSPQFVPAPGPPVMIERGSGPLLLADVNQDGHLDLVTKHLTTRTVTVLLGNGRGSFTPAPECSLKLDFDPGWI